MSGRKRDLTRFKKTYSFSRQEPSVTFVNYRSIVAQARDSTRFRKTYSFIRTSPSVIEPQPPPIPITHGDTILTEDSSELLTEAGANLLTE